MRFKLSKSNLPLVVLILVAFALGIGAGVMIFRPKDENKIVYAIFNNQKITGADVLPVIRGDLEQLEKNRYQLKRRTTEDLIRKKISEMKADPKAGAPEKIAAVPPPEITEEEFNAFLKIRNMDPKKITALDRKNIIGNMQLQKRLELEKKLTDNTMKDAQIQWKIPLPAEDLVSVPKGSMPSLGSLLAPVKLMMISNFHCPNCIEAEKRLNELKEKYKDKLQISYQFTMQEPDNSMVRAAAEASYCAQDQGQFWAFHDHLAVGPIASNPEGLDSAAKAIHLNLETFKDCRTSRKYKLVLMKEIEVLNKSNPLVPPSFVINGKLRSGITPLAELFILIDQELHD